MTDTDNKAQQVFDALDRLTGEVDACWGMAEGELRQALGNTNYQIVQDRLSDARKAIALSLADNPALCPDRKEG